MACYHSVFGSTKRIAGRCAAITISSALGRVVHLALHEGLHVLRNDQLHLMAKLDHFSRAIMRAAAGYHNHHSWGALCHEILELEPCQPFAELHLS